MKSWARTIYPLAKLATPLIITGLTQSSVYFFVSLFLARISEEALGAGSIVAWLFGTFNILIIGILNAVNVLIAYQYGKQDNKKIALIFRDGFRLALIMTIPAFCFFWNITKVFPLFGLDPALIESTQAYLHALCWGLLPNFITISLLELFIGIGQTRTILFFTTLNVSLNIFFSYLLIFGALGFPQLGVAGAGWGTTIGFWITSVCLGMYLFINKQYKPYTKYFLAHDKPRYMREVIKVGTPLGLMMSLEVGFFLAMILIVASFGTQLLAANQIALQYSSILMSIIFSIAQAITVRMGHLLGEDKLSTAKKTGYIGTVISVIIMLIVALVYWLFPRRLVSVDFDVYAPENQTLVYYAAQFLGACAVFQIFEASRLSLFGALRAIKDTRFTLYVSILSFWGIALPVGYLLSVYYEPHGVGMWWGMALSAVINTLLLYWRFDYKMRRYSVEQG